MLATKTLLTSNIYFQVFKERKWLGNISYQNGSFEFSQTSGKEENVPQTFDQILDEARTIAANAAKAAQKIPVPDQVKIISLSLFYKPNFFVDISLIIQVICYWSQPSISVQIVDNWAHQEQFWAG